VGYNLTKYIDKIYADDCWEVADDLENNPYLYARLVQDYKKEASLYYGYEFYKGDSNESVAVGVVSVSELNVIKENIDNSTPDFLKEFTEGAELQIAVLERFL
jgi:hypothetical protein